MRLKVVLKGRKKQTLKQEMKRRQKPGNERIIMMNGD
jgi:hypothetical protein